MNNTCMPPQFIRLGSELNQHGQAALQLHASSSCPLIFQGTFFAGAGSTPSSRVPAPSDRIMGRRIKTMHLRIHTPSLRFEPIIPFAHTKTNSKPPELPVMIWQLRV